MVSLTRKPVAAPVEPVVPVVAPAAPIAPPPQSDTPNADVLEQAANEIPLPDASALQQQLAALQQSEQQQREAFEQQRLLHAQMQIEKAQQPPKQEQGLTDRDREFLDSRPGIERDASLGPTANALAYAFGPRTDDYYRALAMKYPIENYRRIEPPTRQEDNTPPALATAKSEKPQRRLVVQAPPSRGVPSDSYTAPLGKVTLSATEREIAAASRLPGQTQAEAEVAYARNKSLLNKMKAEGHFQNER